MKKLLTAALLVLVGVTLTGCTLLNKDKTKQDLKTEMSETSIADVLKGGNNQECTYTSVIDNVTTKGKMYIADKGKKMAHTINVDTEEGTQELQYIMKDDWFYSWGTNMPGMKMQLSKLEEMGEDLETEDNMDEEMSIDYKEMGFKEDLKLECKNWRVDESKFDIPSNIEFMDATQTLMDFTEQFKETTEKADDMNDSMCAACNMAPDEQTKKECMASLGCN